MSAESPNLIEGLDPNNYGHLGEDFAMPPTSSGWYETDDGHRLPYQIVGDLEGSDRVAVVHHGGPGDSIKESHVAPLLGVDGLSVMAYNQRLSGSGEHYSQYDGDLEDPLPTHSPEVLVGDVEGMREELLDGRSISNVGGSWGSALSLLHAEAHPESADNSLIWSVTLARNKEALSRYESDGDLAVARPAEYERFINSIPEDVRSEIQDSPLEVIKFYDKAMDPTQEGYDPELAHDLAAAFGILHLTAADPEGMGAMGLVDMQTEQIYGLAQMAGINPDLYARVAMRNFAEHFPRIGDGEGEIIQNIGRLAGKGLYIVSGSEDLLTPVSASADLEQAAQAASVDVTRHVVEGGQHDRTYLSQAIHEGAKQL